MNAIRVKGPAVGPAALACAVAMVGCAPQEIPGEGVRTTTAIEVPSGPPALDGTGGHFVELGPPGSWGTANSGATPQQNDALEWVNYVRQQAGLPFVELSPQLNAASVAHASFITANYALYEAGMSLHEEADGYPGFTGKKYWERQEAAGHPGKSLSEVISYQPLASASVMQWIDSVYHRLPLTHPEAAGVGYGSATNDQVTVSVMEISKLAVPVVTSPVAYPPNGATDVPVAWDGNEIPQPPIPPTGYPSGPIFTLQMPTAGELTVSTHSLRDDTGVEIPHMMLEPSNDPYLFDAPVVVIYANDPLATGRRYTVSITGQYLGEPFSWTSGFQTEASRTCDMLAQDCRAGQACYALGEERLCAWSGPIPVGGACHFQNDCGAGATCVQAVCRTLCDAEDREGPKGCSTICQEGFALLTTEGDIGVCNPLPCSPLTESCGNLVCVADTIIECAPAGTGEAGQPCGNSSDCAIGFGCLAIGGASATCQALCDSSPLAAEPNAPHGDIAALPSCFESCPSGAVSHPVAADVGVCTQP